MKIKKLTNTLACMVLLISLHSCSNHTIVADNTIPAEDAGKFLVDSISIDSANFGLHPITGTNIRYSIGKNDPVVWYFGKKEIYKYSFNRKCIIDSISIPHAANIDFYHANFFIDSVNKLYLVGRGHSNSIFVFKDTTAYQVRYHDNDSPKNYLQNAYDPLTVGNNILLCKAPYYFLMRPAERRKFYSSNTLSILTIKDTSLVEKRYFARFPDDYKKNDYDIFQPVCTIVGDSVVYYCFPTSNIVYKYNIDKGTTEEIKLKGVPENNIKPYNDDSISIPYATKYAITNSNFTSLSYDKYSNHMLLLQSPAIAYAEDSLGHIPEYDDKPVIANVLDSTFNCIKKIRFDKQIFCTTTLFYKNRFYVPRFHRSQLKIYVYEF